MVFVLMGAVLLVMVALMVVLHKNSPKNIKKGIPLEEVFPIQAIEEGVAINGLGDLTVGFSLMLPDIFSISEADSVSMHEAFVGLLKVLPVGAIVHKQDLFYTSTYRQTQPAVTKIRQSNEDMLNGRPVLLQRSNIYLTIPNRIKQSKSTTLQRLPNYLFKQPFTYTQKDLEAFEKVVENFSNGLITIPGFGAERMGSKELAQNIHEYVNQTYGEEASGEDLRVNPIHVDDEGNLMVGENRIRVISLVEEGPILEPHKIPMVAPSGAYGNGIRFSNTIKSKTSMVFPLAAGLPVDHVLNTIIQITDNDSITSELNSEGSKMGFLGNFYPPAGAKANVIKKYVDTITNYGFQSCVTSVSVVLRAKQLNELDRLSGLTQTAFINMGKSRGFVENYETANLLFGTIPGNPVLSLRGFINTTAQAVSYVNKEAMLTSSALGIPFVDRFGRPIVLDMWDNPNTVNRNELVLGPSGSGKSFAINAIVSGSLDLGGHVIIIDIGHSYKRSCELNGGVYYDSSDRKSLSFNVFECPKDSKGRYIYRDTEDDQEEGKVDFIVTVLLCIVYGQQPVSPIERALYKRSVEQYYERVNGTENPEATLEGYVEYIQREFYQTLEPDHQEVFRVKDIVLIIEPFLTGSYKYLLSAKSSVDITKEKFIVFDLEAVEKNPVVFPIMVILIMELVIQKIQKLKGVRKTLIVDEALNFLQDPKMGEFIGYLYRTFRKKEGKVCIAAQNVKFLEAADPVVKDSIILNTATKILLDHSEHTSNYADIQRVLSFTQHEIELLDSLEKGQGYREIFIKMGKVSSIYRVEVSDYAGAIYTSKESEVQEIHRLFKELGSLDAALEQYVYNKRRTA